MNELPANDEPQLFPATRTVDSVALVLQFKKLWDQGQGVSASEFLRLYPGEAESKDLVVDLVYEEFCRRLDGGEAVDAGEFAGRFPHYKSSLCNLLVAHQFFAQNPELLDEEEVWPVVGQEYHGFHIVRELGKGSFARVFLAREEALGMRPVALKVSPSGTAESLLQGQLAHDNIVPIHSIQHRPGSRLSIVCMPFLGQATLLDVLDRAFADGAPEHASVIRAAAWTDLLGAQSNRRPDALLDKGTYIEGVAHLGRQLARALAFVHQRKIFHRDLKPSNVLLTPDGKPMLLDFNLAAQENKPGQPLGGTIVYMAPEQLEATDAEYTGLVRPLDERTDLYSLGIILFELLTGRHPFGPIDWKQPPQELRHTLLKLQSTGPRSLTELAPQVDAKLAAIVQRCLAYEPKLRYPSGAELAADLDKYLAPTQRVQQRVRRRWPWLVGGAMAAALLLAVAVVPTLFREPAEVQQYKAAVKAYQAGEYGAAINYFSRLMDADPTSAKLRYCRGKSRLKVGDIKGALEDFLRARDLQPSTEISPLLHASIAFCNNQLPVPNHTIAVAEYEIAKQQGFSNAALLNNLGYSCLKTQGGRSKASDVLLKAQQLNPDLQVPYYGLAYLDLFKFTVDCNSPNAKVREQAAIPPRAFESIQKAIDLGPPSGELYYDAACLHALAAERHRVDPGVKESHRQSALGYIEKAVEHGISHAKAKSDLMLRVIHEDARFRKLADIRPNSTARVYVSLLDPTPDMIP